MKFHDVILEPGFVESKMDKCVFINSSIICLFYVDDTILSGTNEKYVAEDIKGLKIRQDKQRHSFELCDEGYVGDFLGIRIEQQKDLKHYQCPHFRLYQTGLTNRVLKLYHLAYCNPRKTLSQTLLLGLDCNGVHF